MILREVSSAVSVVMACKACMRRQTSAHAWPLGVRHGPWDLLRDTCCRSLGSGHDMGSVASVRAWHGVNGPLRVNEPGKTGTVQGTKGNGGGGHYSSLRLGGQTC